LETASKEELQIIEGIVPSLNELPSGCRFRTRCDFEKEKCGKENPRVEFMPEDSSHGVACIRWREIN
jgi:oligopeptide/dipeptide ABC transporter ATP-binding protein